MKTRIALVVLAVGMTGMLEMVAEAGTLERRIIAIYAGRVEPGGDLEELTDQLDDIYTFGITAALPFNPYFAVIGNIGRTSITGDFSENGFRAELDTTVTAYTAGARVHLMPGQVFNPFASAAYSYSTIDVTIEEGNDRFSDDFTEKAIILAGGAELLLGDRFTIVGAYSRVMPQEDDDELGFVTSDDRDVVSIALNFWVTNNFLLTGSFAQELEDDSQTYQIAVGLAF